MQLTGKKRVESASHPGVWLTAKFLNAVQRAKRDGKILAERARYARLVEEQAAVVAGIWRDLVRDQFEPGEAGDQAFAEERRKRLLAAPAELRHKADALYEEQDCLYRSHLMPAELRAALVQVEGLVIDGKQVLTVEDFLELAPDALLDEAAALCRSVTGLSGDQEKN